jgi:hypothetical protein
MKFAIKEQLKKEVNANTTAIAEIQVKESAGTHTPYYCAKSN